MYKSFLGPKNTQVIIASIIGILFCISVGSFLWQSHYYKRRLMQSHLKQLVIIFDDINLSVGIENFEHTANHIDFLNVKKFLGSTLGPMNIRYPERWRGPYVVKNPTLQEKYYQVIKTFKGYFIAPGEGVTLPNGKTIGTDIKFTYESDIEALTQDAEALSYKGELLARAIPTLNFPQSIKETGQDPYNFLSD